MKRKKYLKPEVESESYIEQTSLACNLIQGWELVGEPAFSTGECTTDVTKEGNWGDIYACTVGVYKGIGICEPETYGTPLS